MNNAAMPADVLDIDLLDRRASSANIPWDELDVVTMLAENSEWGQEALLHAAVIWAFLMTPSTSAGVSIIEPRLTGEILSWVAVAGAHEHLRGHEVARDQSTCGHALEHGGVLHFFEPTRQFEELAIVNPRIAEVLAAPIYTGEAKPWGTIWMFSDPAGPGFSRNDADLLECLARHLTAAIEIAGRRP
jgi:GAF domain-containing protein